ncbi:hypothetical protein [Pseudomonas sp. NFX98]|uniref:hypothetical protein n=1 Tax=Pseudomonas sp. NFX98 TaxID=3399122 RepID=UPI0039FB9364
MGPHEVGAPWFAMFRFYGTDKALFDKSWELEDIEISNECFSPHRERLLLAVFCRSRPPSVLVKSDANDWSSRMQMGGQVHAIKQLEGQAGL